MDDKSQEKLVIGTLGTIAAAAAPIAPIGTIASVVIIAGIGIYSMVDKTNEENLKKLNESLEADEMQKILKMQDDTLGKILARPQVSLDLNSGPPMYWIVPAQAGVPAGGRSYRVPGGEVDWPTMCHSGTTPGEGCDEKNIDLSRIYAPDFVTTEPTLCVFFWAVPLFFARIQQRICEEIFGVGMDPMEPPDNRFPNNKTKYSVASEIMEKILRQGKLDKTGNWFAPIGTAIPALSFSTNKVKIDDAFAPRFYGRKLFAHEIAKRNILYSDGSRLSCATDLVKTGLFTPEENKINYAALLASQQRSAECPFGQIVSGSIQPLRGVYSKASLLSMFNIPGWDQLSHKDTDDLDSIYYVNAVRSDDSGIGAVEPYFPRFMTEDPRSMRIHTNIAEIGFSKYGAKLYPNSSAENGLSLYPYSLFMKAGLTAISSTDFSAHPSLDVLSGMSSFGFLDFDPADLEKTNPAWLKALAIMPIEYIIPLQPEKLSPKKIDYPYYYAKVRNYLIDDRLKYPTYYDWLMDAAKSYGAYTLYGSQWSELLLKSISFQINTFRVSLCTSSSDQSGNVAKKCPQIRLIVKNRPPKLGEICEILPEQLWGDAGKKWAFGNSYYLGNTRVANFALVEPKIPNGYKLVVYKINKNNMVGCQGVAQIAAYLNSNIEENKPIVAIPGQDYPSPFYCGRRADSRSQFVWQTVRKLTSLNGAPSKSPGDTGWEDCHAWSWPYDTATLNTISASSKKIYKELGEGIGRAGCSPYSVATGPTLWGDVDLYRRSYAGLFGGDRSNNPSDVEGFKKTLAVIIWESLIEVQVGSYIRYATRTNNTYPDITKTIEEKFAVFSNSTKSYDYYVNEAKKHIDKGNSPKIWDGNKYIELTPEQFANYSMALVSAWYDNYVPKPVKSHEERFSVGAWTCDLLEDCVRSHIKLKNWAIDPDHYGMPTDFYDIGMSGLIALSGIKSGVSVPISKAYSYNFTKIQDAVPIFSKSTTATTVTEKKKINIPLIASVVAISACVAILAATGFRKKQ